MINKFILILLVFAFSCSVNASKDSDSVYNLVKYYGDEYITSLKSSSIVGLTDKELLLREYAILIMSNPGNEKYQLSYLELFPKGYVSFNDVFQRYEGVVGTSLVIFSYIYIDLLERISLKFPVKSVQIYIGISKDACFSADLLNYFRTAFKKFIRKNNILVESEKNKLSDLEIESINDFLKARLYGKLSCKDRI